MQCVAQISGICFVRPINAGDASVFRFADFITALALLVIVYTVSDVRYRFRLAIAPTMFHLYVETFVLIGVIGLGTILTDIWLVEHWPVPESLITQSIWRGVFAVLFLSLAMTWMWYAFIWPPIFGKRNFQRFANALYGVVVRGSSEDLPVIANELGRSAEALVKYSRIDRLEWAAVMPQTVAKEPPKSKKATVADIAHDVLLLIGNRKLCRYIVDSSSVTAIAFFEGAAQEHKPGLPLQQFAKNISAEAIINKDSVLYHEDEGFSAGLTGYLKPFSRAIYGNFALVEDLASKFGSPLDIEFEIRWSWDAAQWEAYCRAVTMTLDNYVKGGYWGAPSYSLNRAFSNIEDATRDLYLLDERDDAFYSSDISTRLDEAVKAIRNIVDIFGKTVPIPKCNLRVRDNHNQETLYDRIANLMLKVIFDASAVKSPQSTCWTIHHNMVWSQFFGIGQQGKAWDIIQFKLRRLLYDEVIYMDKLVNYKSARVLGYCLNVMGLTLQPGKEAYGRDYYALKRVIINWTKRNYLRVREVNSDVADACLIGGITYDAARVSLVKTYARGLDREAPREYLALGTPTSESGIAEGI